MKPDELQTAFDRLSLEQQADFSARYSTTVEFWAELVKKCLAGEISESELIKLMDSAISTEQIKETWTENHSRVPRP